MKIYMGIDMAKDKFDYCAMDDTLNILCRGSNKENKNERFRELLDLIKTLKSTSNMMKIGMESTGIYHIPLYNHMRYLAIDSASIVSFVVFLTLDFFMPLTSRPLRILTGNPPVLRWLYNGI